MEQKAPTERKGTVNVWLPSSARTAPSDLHKLDDERLIASVQFQNIDMSPSGWTRVGTAEVIITLDDRKTVTANQVVMLQSQLKEMPACLARALAPMAPPQSVIHRIIQEDDLLAADRARNVNKSERATQANADRALDLQIKFQNLPGAWA